MLLLLRPGRGVLEGIGSGLLGMVRHSGALGGEVGALINTE
jgi:hypothetical protein